MEEWKPGVELDVRGDGSRGREVKRRRPGAGGVGELDPEGGRRVGRADREPGEAAERRRERGAGPRVDAGLQMERRLGRGERRRAGDGIPAELDRGTPPEHHRQPIPAMDRKRDAAGGVDRRQPELGVERVEGQFDLELPSACDAVWRRRRQGNADAGERRLEARREILEADAEMIDAVEDRREGCEERGVVGELLRSRAPVEVGVGGGGRECREDLPSGGRPGPQPTDQFAVEVAEAVRSGDPRLPVAAERAEIPNELLPGGDRGRMRGERRFGNDDVEFAERLVEEGVEIEIDEPRRATQGDRLSGGRLPGDVSQRRQLEGAAGPCGDGRVAKNGEEIERCGGLRCGRESEEIAEGATGERESDVVDPRRGEPIGDEAEDGGEIGKRDLPMAGGDLRELGARRDDHPAPAGAGRDSEARHGGRRWEAAELDGDPIAFGGERRVGGGGETEGPHRARRRREFESAIEG